MTTVKVKFRPSTVEDRPGTIVYLVTHRRIARQITTSYKVFPCEWDEERSEPVLVSDSSRTNIINRITQKLRSDMERLEAIIKRFDNGRSSYSSDDVVAEFRHTERENTFFQFHGKCHRTVTAVESYRHRQELPCSIGQFQAVPKQRGHFHCFHRSRTHGGLSGIYDLY